MMLEVLEELKYDLYCANMDVYVLKHYLADIMIQVRSIIMRAYGNIDIPFKMGYPSWEKSGSKDATELANEMIDKRIASYVPVECTKEQEDILRGYIGELYDTI